MSDKKSSIEERVEYSRRRDAQESIERLKNQIEELDKKRREVLGELDEKLEEVSNLLGCEKENVTREMEECFKEDNFLIKFAQEEIESLEKQAEDLKDEIMSLQEKIKQKKEVKEKGSDNIKILNFEIDQKLVDRNIDIVEFDFSDNNTEEIIQDIIREKQKDEDDISLPSTYTPEYGLEIEGIDGYVIMDKDAKSPLSMGWGDSEFLGWFLLKNLDEEAVSSRSELGDIKNISEIKPEEGEGRWDREEVGQIKANKGTIVFGTKKSSGFGETNTEMIWKVKQEN